MKLLGMGSYYSFCFFKVWALAPQYVKLSEDKVSAEKFRT